MVPARGSGKGVVSKVEVKQSEYVIKDSSRECFNRDPKRNPTLADVPVMKRGPEFQPFCKRPQLLPRHLSAGWSQEQI